jgi:hypothetical protein
VVDSSIIPKDRDDCVESDVHGAAGADSDSCLLFDSRFLYFRASRTSLPECERDGRRLKTKKHT